MDNEQLANQPGDGCTRPNTTRGESGRRSLERRQWTARCDLGTRARGKLPPKNKLVWIEFNVEVAEEQTLDLTFNGAIGSHVLVDNANVPIAEKGTDAPRIEVPLPLFAGQHRVLVAIVGNGTLSELEVRLGHRWDPLAQAKRWSACSERERLRMLAATRGPLGDFANRDKAAELDRAITRAEAGFTTSLVAEELPQPRQTRFLVRGEYDRPAGEPLEPGILSVMGQFPADAPRDRRGLATWLTSPDHPLVTRVLVNRLWQQTFGHALVRTPEDFGLQGEQPTHPRLLDWLAVDLRDSGWNMKRLLKAMVTSRTFRQTSRWRNDVDDPENRLLARSSSYRLDAEVVRDIGLWSSGLLDSHMGGEGVKPYQPVGMWAAPCIRRATPNNTRVTRENGFTAAASTFTGNGRVPIR